MPVIGVDPDDFNFAYDTEADELIVEPPEGASSVRWEGTAASGSNITQKSQTVAIGADGERRLEFHPSVDSGIVAVDTTQ